MSHTKFGTTYSIKETWPFVLFWVISVVVISGRFFFDLKTYYWGSTLVYRDRTGEKYDYLIHLPKKYTDYNGPRPLILYLHGAGEVGKDVRILKTMDVAYYVNSNELDDFPFIVVSPMSPMRGWKPGLVIKLLDTLLNDDSKRWKIDSSRIYITGASMGGFGAFRTACEYPDRFAAIVPVAGGGDVEHVWRLKGVPTWAFHGDADNVVSYEYSEKMITEMQNLGFDDARLTMINGAGHNINHDVYAKKDIYCWMLTKQISPCKNQTHSH